MSDKYVTRWQQNASALSTIPSEYYITHWIMGLKWMGILYNNITILWLFAFLQHVDDQTDR